MGSKARLQYAFGFALALGLNIQLVDTVESSLDRQRAMLYELNRNSQGQVYFRKDFASKPSVKTAIYNAYVANFAERLYRIFK